MVEVAAAKTVVRERQRLLCSQVGQVEQFLASHTPNQLVVEATIGYEWFADLADKHADRVVLAHSTPTLFPQRHLGCGDLR